MEPTTSTTTYLVISQIATTVAAFIAILNLFKKDKAKEKQIIELKGIISELKLSNDERKKQTNKMQEQLDVMKETFNMNKDNSNFNKLEKIKGVEPYFKQGNDIGIFQRSFNSIFVNKGKGRGRITNIEIIQENSNINVNQDAIRNTNYSIINKSIAIDETFKIIIEYDSDKNRMEILLMFRILFENIYNNKYAQVIYISNGKIEEHDPELLN